MKTITKKACLFGMLSIKRISKRKFLDCVRKQGALPDISSFDEGKDEYMGVREVKNDGDDLNHGFRYSYSVFAIKVGEEMARWQKSISIENKLGRYVIDDERKVIEIARGV